MKSFKVGDRVQVTDDRWGTLGEWGVVLSHNSIYFEVQLDGQDYSFPYAPRELRSKSGIDQVLDEIK